MKTDSCAHRPHQELDTARSGLLLTQPSASHPPLSWPGEDPAEWWLLIPCPKYVAIITRVWLGWLLPHEVSHRAGVFTQHQIPKMSGCTGHMRVVQCLLRDTSLCRRTTSYLPGPVDVCWVGPTWVLRPCMCSLVCTCKRFSRTADLTLGRSLNKARVKCRFYTGAGPRNRHFNRHARH